MPISPEDAGAEIQRFLTGLNASKHSAREKALKAFKAFVEKQGMEFYDDDVDSLLLGDGYTMGLMQWCGESSTGTQGALKRWVVVRLDVDFLQQLDLHPPWTETLHVGFYSNHLPAPSSPQNGGHCHFTAQMARVPEGLVGGRKHLSCKIPSGARHLQ